MIIRSAQTGDLKGFKNGKYRVLVATDIAARGIDVKGIELVVNYDLPTMAEDYDASYWAHRALARKGTRSLFAMPEQRREMRGIEQVD